MLAPALLTSSLARHLRRLGAAASGPTAAKFPTRRHATKPYNPKEGAPWYCPTPLDLVGDTSDGQWPRENFNAWLEDFKEERGPVPMDAEAIGDLAWRAFRAGYLATNRRHIQRGYSRLRAEREFS